MNENQLTLSTRLSDCMLQKNYDEISKLCHPLFKKTPIDYFDYIRYYDSGEMIVFSTNPEFNCTNHLEGCLYPRLEELELCTRIGLKFFFLTPSMPVPAGVDVDKFQRNISLGLKHGVNHRLYLTDRQADFYTTYGFGVTREIASVFNYFLNSLPVLERFIKYFEQHANEIIAENVEENGIIMPYYFDKQSYLIEGEDVVPFMKHVEFPIETSHSFIGNNVGVTPRELDSLTLIAQGHTMKSAAKKLTISPRTVEQHLRNLKDKFGLNTKTQLVDLWHENYKD